MSLNCLCLIYQEARVLLFDLPILMLQNSDAKLVLNYSIQTGEAFILSLCVIGLYDYFLIYVFSVVLNFLELIKSCSNSDMTLFSLSICSYNIQHPRRRKRRAKGIPFLACSLNLRYFSRFHTYIGHIICKPLHLLLKIDICLQAFNCTVR